MARLEPLSFSAGKIKKISAQQDTAVMRCLFFVPEKGDDLS